jgi:hypothetical protein
VPRKTLEAVLRSPALQAVARKSGANLTDDAFLARLVAAAGFEVENEEPPPREAQEQAQFAMRPRSDPSAGPPTHEVPRPAQGVASRRLALKQLRLYQAVADME